MRDEEITRSLLSQVKFLDGVPLIKAVVRTYDRYDENDKKPGSAKYEINTRKYRREMIDAVAEEWASETGHDDSEFPFSDDYIVSLWVAYRKLTASEKGKIARCCRLPDEFKEMLHG